MELKLKLETSNAAFHNDCNGHNEGEEVASILRVLADKVEQGECGGLLRDTNGNHVGVWGRQESDDIVRDLPDDIKGLALAEHRNLECEVDVDSRISICEDEGTPGFYVEAWHWVNLDEAAHQTLLFGEGN